eukprot:12431452-Karenia_brevis.AAC.4
MTSNDASIKKFKTNKRKPPSKCRAGKQSKGTQGKRNAENSPDGIARETDGANCTRRSPGVWYEKIAEVAGHDLRLVRGVLQATLKVAAQDLRETGSFDVPELFSLQVFNKAGAPPKSKNSFGRVIQIAAKPPSKGVNIKIPKQFKAVVENAMNSFGKYEG